MVPKAVQEVGYTAVGLGVLALQQVHAQRRNAVRQGAAVVNAIRSLPRAAARVVQNLKL